MSQEPCRDADCGYMRPHPREQCRRAVAVARGPHTASPFVEEINTERPLSAYIRMEQAREAADLEALKPRYEQRDGYRVRVRP